MAPNEESTPPSLSSVPLVGMAVNAALATLKILAGVFGNSYALIADGMESTSDIVTSLVVWGGLRVAVAPADERHPYGYGKAEALARTSVGAAGAVLQRTVKLTEVALGTTALAPRRPDGPRPAASSQ